MPPRFAAKCLRFARAASNFPLPRASLVQAAHGARRRTDGELQCNTFYVLYVNESGWGHLTPEQQEQGVAAYKAYGEALRKAGASAARTG